MQRATYEISHGANMSQNDITEQRAAISEAIGAMQDLPAAATATDRKRHVKEACDLLRPGALLEDVLNEPIRFALSPKFGIITAPAWLTLAVSCEELFGRIGGLQFREARLQGVLDACLSNQALSNECCALGSPAEAAAQKGALYCASRLMQMDREGYESCLIALGGLSLTAGLTMEKTTIEFATAAVAAGYDINRPTKAHNQTVLDYAEEGGFKHLAKWAIESGGVSKAGPFNEGEKE